MRPEVILAIESSCDETAVAAVDSCGRVLTQHMSSQIAEHNRFGGVVPEVAARSHFRELDGLVETCLKDLSGCEVRAVAATTGPGLIGPLLVGAQYARGLARGWNKAFIGVHHLRGHLASVLVERDMARFLKDQAGEVFPALVLLVSGGHTQVLRVESNLWAQSLATTADDSAGECFDKSAKIMGLAYPGGPEIERCAQRAHDVSRADELFRSLPLSKSAQGFSFSGLKTAIRLKIEQNPELKADPAMCFAIQRRIGQTLERGLLQACPEVDPSLKRLIFCGGVSANQYLRQHFEGLARRMGLEALFPPLRFATDNAAMIAAAAWVQDDKLHMPDVIARRPLNPDTPGSGVAP
jgi:N6-L-threonylcarbamoyladenine synthase